MLKNPLLQQAQEKVEDSVTDRDSYQKILEALTAAVYDKNTFPQLADAVAKSQEPLQVVADGIVGLLGVLANKSRGTMPHAPAMQAGFAMFLDALDFMEQAGQIKVDDKLLEQATRDYVEALLPKTGITEQKLNDTLGQIAGAMSDPQRLAAFQAAQGGK